jgi:hypothetical protein
MRWTLGGKFELPTWFITRDTKTKELLNKIETKEFGFVYDKRVILENFDTIPFGF